MIQLKKHIDDPDQIEKVLDENQQLILIFGKSIDTTPHWILVIGIGSWVLHFCQHPIPNPNIQSVGTDKLFIGGGEGVEHRVSGG